MSIEHLVKCDGPACVKRIPYHPLEWGGREPIPDDWYILANGEGSMEHLHFCSLNCVAGWAAEVRRGPSAQLDIPADTRESFSISVPMR